MINNKNKRIITVSPNDKELGFKSFEETHLGKGILHRAITIFIFNNRGEILITKRSNKKMLWPGFWDTTCSSHPTSGETYEKAGMRRLKEELGINCNLKLIGKFQYKAKYNNIGSENEICAILTGTFVGKIVPNLDEISEYRWITKDYLKREIEKGNSISPWLKIAFKRHI